MTRQLEQINLFLNLNRLTPVRYYVPKKFLWKTSLIPDWLRLALPCQPCEWSWVGYIMSAVVALFCWCWTGLADGVVLIRPLTSRCLMQLACSIIFFGNLMTTLLRSFTPLAMSKKYPTWKLLLSLLLITGIASVLNTVAMDCSRS